MAFSELTKTSGPLNGSLQRTLHYSNLFPPFTYPAVHGVYPVLGPAGFLATAAEELNGVNGLSRDPKVLRRSSVRGGLVSFCPDPQVSLAAFESILVK